MEIVIYLAIFMIIVGAFFLGLFLFAVKNGQFNDLETPAHKILLDDESPVEKKAESVIKYPQSTSKGEVTS